MRTLGLSTLDELQARLEAEPESWSKRELMELAELTLLKSRVLPPTGSDSGPGSTSGGVQVNLQFVTAAPIAEENSTTCIEAEVIGGGAEPIRSGAKKD